MRVSTVSVAAAMLLAVLSLRAHADPSGSRGPIVYYGDLKLGTEADAMTLLQRIELAAEKACHGHDTFGPYIGSLSRTFEECRSETVQRAVKQLAAPMVTRVYKAARMRES